MDDDFDGGESEAFSVCSSPLSEPVDSIVLEASSRASIALNRQTLNMYIQEARRTSLSITLPIFAKAQLPPGSGITAASCASSPAQSLKRTGVVPCVASKKGA
jgi:hypothetical protein